MNNQQQVMGASSLTSTNNNKNKLAAAGVDNNGITCVNNDACSSGSDDHGRPKKLFLQLFQPPPFPVCFSWNQFHQQPKLKKVCRHSRNLQYGANTGRIYKYAYFTSRSIPNANHKIQSLLEIVNEVDSVYNDFLLKNARRHGSEVYSSSNIASGIPIYRYNKVMFRDKTCNFPTYKTLGDGEASYPKDHRKLFLMNNAMTGLPTPAQSG